MNESNRQSESCISWLKTRNIDVTKEISEIDLDTILYGSYGMSKDLLEREPNLIQNHLMVLSSKDVNIGYA